MPGSTCYHFLNSVCPICGKVIDYYFYTIRNGEKICLDCRDAYDKSYKL